MCYVIIACIHSRFKVGFLTLDRCCHGRGLKILALSKLRSGCCHKLRANLKNGTCGHLGNTFFVYVLRDNEKGNYFKLITFHTCVAAWDRHRSRAPLNESNT